MADKCPQRPSIVFTKYNPYLVTGLGKLIDSNGNNFEIRPVMSLCRCGQSKKKPYCDGTHVKDGIKGEKEEGRVKDRVRNYVGREITIHDNRGVCSHDGSCLYLPNVFNKYARPWIDPDGAPAEKIIETIRKCPSGALSYTINGIHHASFESEVMIKAAKNGPFEVYGGIELKDDVGSKPQCEDHYCLCRCNHSKNKPFCDGSHLHNIPFDV